MFKDEYTNIVRSRVTLSVTLLPHKLSLDGNLVQSIMFDIGGRIPAVGLLSGHRMISLVSGPARHIGLATNLHDADPLTEGRWETSLNCSVILVPGFRRGWASSSDWGPLGGGHHDAAVVIPRLRSLRQSQQHLVRKY